MTVLEVLEKARKILDESAWIRGAMRGLDENGRAGYCLALYDRAIAAEKSRRGLSQGKKSS